MNDLCFLSNLTSSEWASWVQAIGSMLAIIAAAWIAKRQANLQHESALELLKTERGTARVDAVRNLSALAKASARVMSQVSTQLGDCEKVHLAAEGLVHCDIGEVQRLDGYISAIPVHEMPEYLVAPTLVLGATLRQFRDKVEMTLRIHHMMDANMFEDFFLTLRKLNESAKATCHEIAIKPNLQGSTIWSERPHK